MLDSSISGDSLSLDKPQSRVPALIEEKNMKCDIPPTTGHRFPLLILSLFSPFHPPLLLLFLSPAVVPWWVPPLASPHLHLRVVCLKHQCWRWRSQMHGVESNPLWVTTRTVCYARYWVTLWWALDINKVHAAIPFYCHGYKRLVLALLGDGCSDRSAHKWIHKSRSPVNSEAETLDKLWDENLRFQN